MLVVSFATLAILRPQPKLERDRWRALPGGVGRALGSRRSRSRWGHCVVLLALVLTAGFAARRTR